MAMLESMLVSGLPATAAAQLLFALDMVCRENPKTGDDDQ
jgi:hypothetical protein